MSRASPSLRGLLEQPLLLHGDFAGSSLHGEDAFANTLPSDDDGESDGIVAQFAAANKAGPACHCLSAFKDPELERRCVAFARIGTARCESRAALAPLASRAHTPPPSPLHR